MRHRQHNGILLDLVSLWIKDQRLDNEEKIAEEKELQELQEEEEEEEEEKAKTKQDIHIYVTKTLKGDCVLDITL